MTFGLTITKDGRRLYVVYYDALTGKHRPIGKEDMKLLQAQILADIEFEELKQRIKHPKLDMGP